MLHTPSMQRRSNPRQSNPHCPSNASYRTLLQAQTGPARCRPDRPPPSGYCLRSGAVTTSNYGELTAGQPDRIHSVPFRPSYFDLIDSSVVTAICVSHTASRVTFGKESATTVTQRASFCPSDIAIWTGSKKVWRVLELYELFLHLGQCVKYGSRLMLLIFS